MSSVGLSRRWASIVALTGALLAATALAAAASDAGIVADAPAAPAPAAAAPAPPLTGALLGAALRRGGYVIYFRHTSTDFGQNDDAMTTFEDCAQQRNLTDRGRDEARVIGAAMTRQRIPVDEVLASPYCRTLETARLMLGRATPTPAVRGGPTQADPQRYAGLSALLSAPPRPGRNRVIVSHGNPFRALVDVPYLAEGEAAIVEPQGGGRFRLVGRIVRDGWDSLGSG